MRHVLLLTAVLVACSSDGSSLARQDARPGIDRPIETRPDAAADMPMGAEVIGAGGVLDVAGGFDGAKQAGGDDGAAAGVDTSGTTGGAGGTGGGVDAGMGAGGSTGLDAPGGVDAPMGGDAPPAEAGALKDPWLWVVIQDTEQRTCTSNAPGADIDAVSVLSGKTAGIVGWGKVGSAHFTPNPLGNSCDNADCSGGNCKYTAMGLTFTAQSMVSLTEGPADGMVSATADDSGYLALNGGTLQIQISGVDGGGAWAIQSGSLIRVYEMDKTYVASGAAPAACTCLPEHYTVGLQTATGQYLALRPSQLSMDNTTCSALTATTMEGCGTTTFVVP